MSNKNKLLCLLMSLLLAFANVVFSAHVSSHTASDSGLCSLCIHPGGPDTAIAHEPGALFVRLEAFTFTWDHTPNHFRPVVLHAHQSRAPPLLA